MLSALSHVFATLAGVLNSRRCCWFSQLSTAFSFSLLTDVSSSRHCSQLSLVFSALIGALSSLASLCNSRWCLKLSSMSLTLAGFLNPRRLSYSHLSPMSPALTIALNSNWCSQLSSVLSALSHVFATLAGVLNSRRCR